MPESKSKFLIPAVGAAVVVAGSIAAYMYFKSPSGASSNALGSAKLVPSTALMATYITTDSQAWAKLQQFGTPEAQKVIAKSLENFNKQMFRDSNVSYEKDIKPWAGSVMIAVLPPNPVKQAQLKVPSRVTNVPTNLQQESNILMVVAGVGVDDAGVRVKAIANLDPQLNKFQYQSSSGNIVGQFPTDTFALVSGNGISRGWETLVEESKNYPEIKQALEQVRGQLKFVNIDLDKDIFGWMNGEFAFGAVPSNQGVLANVGFGGALVFDTSDRKTAEATLTKLDTLAKTQQINVANRNIAGKDVTEWQIPRQGALLAHGWLDQDTVFVALGGPVADAISDRKNQSLNNSDAFKAVTGSLHKPNGGYFYLDMDKTKTVPLINSFISSDPNTITILSSIRGLAFTANSPNKSTSELEMLLALKPNTAK
ncbi:MAG: DUF3352 domain-containing protein [Nostoc indistinguendum CM1-VF10]|jgi:hypothetical protein|nr:DUF3352 domain-containing protein [Nostoc indistinguendum CM1-VF10]